MKKAVFVGILSAAAVCLLAFFVNKESQTDSSSPNTAVEKQSAPQKQAAVQKEETEEEKQPEEPLLPKEIIKHAEMYSSISNNQLPLSGIKLLAELPEDVREEIEDIIDSSKNIYMLKKFDNKLLLLVENPSDSRHNIDLKEISLESEAVKNTPFSLHIAGDETENDIWEYEDNDDTKRPVKHIKHDGENNIEYTEFWNYSADEPVKYEMRDSENRVVSIKKETIDNETSLREEHILYNIDGSTKQSVSISYSGPEITRFTYYNSEKPEEGISIFSDYGADGNKIKETVYTPDFKPVNTYEPIYKDGVRSGIRVLDSQNREIEKILAK